MCASRSVVWASVASVLVVLATSGCGVSSQQLDEAEARVESLSSQGVPDSFVTTAKMMVFNARTAKQMGDGVKTSGSYDSAMTLIEQAETWYESEMNQVRPRVDSLRQTLAVRIDSLTGPQRRIADSLAAALDSLIQKNWLIQAEETGRQLDVAVKALLEDERLAAETAPKTVGTWVATSVAEGEGANAVERKTYVFNADGTMRITEEMKGKRSPKQKEEWKFVSSGDYELKGDTVLMRVKREQCLYQRYWRLEENDGRTTWAKDEPPVYDSVVTDGRKDRYMAYSFMKENLEKKR